MISNNYAIGVSTIAFCFMLQMDNLIVFNLAPHEHVRHFIGKILDVIITLQGVQGFPQAHISFELHLIHPRILSNVVH